MKVSSILLAILITLGLSACASQPMDLAQQSRPTLTHMNKSERHVAVINENAAITGVVVVWVNPPRDPVKD